MAKTKGPLFSLSASGQLAKTLVYGAWKGHKYARQHIVPSNPRTPDQITTRNHLAQLNIEWHNSDRTAEDKLAYSTLALIYGASITGWNQFVRIYKPVLDAGSTPIYFHNGKVLYAAGPNQYTFTCSSEPDTDYDYIIRNQFGVFVAQGTVTSAGDGTITIIMDASNFQKNYTIQILEQENKPRSESGAYKFPAKS